MLPKRFFLLAVIGLCLGGILIFKSVRLERLAATRRLLGQAAPEQTLNTCGTKNCAADQWCCLTGPPTTWLCPPKGQRWGSTLCSNAIFEAPPSVSSFPTRSLPAEPLPSLSLCGRVATGGSPSTMDVQGRYAYVGTQSGMQIFDVGNPAAPALLSTTPVGEGARGIVSLAVAGSHAFVVPSYPPRPLYVLDVSDPVAPALVATTGEITGAYVSLSNGHAYLSDDDFSIFDVSDPAAPQFVGSGSGIWETFGPLSAEGTSLYSSEVLFDVSNPASPKEASRIVKPRSYYRIWVRNGIAYYLSNDKGALQLADLSDPLAPTWHGAVATGLAPQDLDILGNKVFVTAADALEVFDVSDPNNPKLVGSTATDALPDPVAASGGYVYVANRGANTLQIFGQSCPPSPGECADETDNDGDGKTDEADIACRVGEDQCYDCAVEEYKDTGSLSDDYRFDGSRPEKHPCEVPAAASTPLLTGQVAEMSGFQVAQQQVAPPPCPQPCGKHQPGNHQELNVRCPRDALCPPREECRYDVQSARTSCTCQPRPTNNCETYYPDDQGQCSQIAACARGRCIAGKGRCACCGDGKSWGEECDDGNADDTDECTSTCRSTTRCGDGYLYATAPINLREECDDGNRVDGDGCSSECKQEDLCLPLNIGQNNDVHANRVNVVFSGVGFHYLGNVKNTANAWAQSFDNLYPYNTATNKRKMQFWLQTRITPTAQRNSRNHCESVCPVSRGCPGLPNSYYMAICRDETCRSNAGRAFSDYASTRYSEPPGVFLHEFQHIFAHLADEYTEQGFVNYYRRPNCAHNKAQAEQWWGPGQPWWALPWYGPSLFGLDLVNGIERNGGPSDVGYFYGCSYKESNVRPTQTSLMRESRGGITLGSLNEFIVLEKLEPFSGNAPSASLSSPLRFLAQLLGIEQGSQLEESALAVRLKRRDDGAYGIVDVRPTSVLHGVKPTFDEGGVVAARVGDQTFTQTFSPTDVMIAEDFLDDGTIRIADYEETQREEVTVLIGLGDTRLTDDGKAMLPDGSVVPIEVTVAPCSDIDDKRENDCPKPMFRGEPLPPPTIEEVLGEQRREQPMVIPSQPPPLPPALPSSEAPPTPPPALPPPPSRAPFWLLIGLFALSGLGGITWGWRRRRRRGGTSSTTSL